MDTSRPQDNTDYAIMVGSNGGTDPGTDVGAGHADDSLALLPETNIGGVQVVRLIGCGRVSESWFGVDSDRQLEVVVKVLRRPWSNDPTVLAYFHQQLNTIGQLQHSNLANVLEVGQEDGLLYWITEWVKGGSVGPKIRRKGPMDISTALQLVDGAAAGLAEGAAVGLVHGGLKPENILVERSGAVKVSDLGIEYAARQLITGSPEATKLWAAEYMAPEVRSGGIPQITSDIYSLGAILLYAVSGAAPHDGMLDGTSPRITPDLRQLLIRMTKPEPQQRVQDYGELRAAIAETQAGTTVIEHIAAPSNWRNDSSVADVAITLVETQMIEEPDASAREISISPASGAPHETVVEDHDGWQEDSEFSRTIGSTYVQPTLVEAADQSNQRIAELVMADMTEAQQMALVQPRRQQAAVASAVPTVSVAVVPKRSTSKALLLAAFALTMVACAAAWLVSRRQAGETLFPWQKVAKTGHEKLEETQPAPAKQPAQQAVAQMPKASGPNHSPATASPSIPSLQSITSKLAAAPLVVASPNLIVAPPMQATVATPAAPPWEIIVDNATQGAVILQPKEGWQPSAETRASYLGSSLVARAGGAEAKITFLVDVPRDGRYQVWMYWISRPEQLRSAAVPTTIMTASGPINLTVDQVNTPTDFNLVGTFNLKAGMRQPIVTLSTAGVANQSGTVHVSADAVKLNSVGN